MNPDDLLRNLNPEQRLAVANPRGPIQIVAGAGTGKTTTIATRIAYGIAVGAYNPSKVLALSYTARAAAELRDRLLALGVKTVTARTFHSVALAQLQYFWPIHTKAQLPTLEQSKSKLLLEVAKESNFTLDDRQLRDLQTEIEWRKYRLISLEDYEALSDRPDIPGLTSTQKLLLISSYEQLKERRSIVDWEDVLILNLGLLQAEAVALSHVHSQYRHFFVDEFQDMSPLQWELLQTWLGKSRDICVVGDARQAIFGFAGASLSLMHEFDQVLHETERVELATNYRSAPQILAAAKKVLPESQLEPVRGRKNTAGLTEFKEFASVEAEAEWVVRRIQTLVTSGSPLSEIVVLARLSALLEPVFQKLEEAHIPATIRSAPFFQQPKVKLAVNMIRALQVSTNSEPLFVQLSKILSELGWQPKRPEVVDQDWDRLDWIWKRFEKLGEGTTAAELVADLEDLQRTQYEPKLDMVTLGTMHSAKGLEWDNVFAIQLNDSVLPFQRASSKVTDVDEERRLLYVGVTRARQNLFLTLSTIDSLGRRVIRSRFLDGI